MCQCLEDHHVNVDRCWLSPNLFLDILSCRGQVYPEAIMELVIADLICRIVDQMQLTVAYRLRYRLFQQIP